MSLILAALVAAGPALPVRAQPCRRPGTERVVGQPRVRAQRLGDMPPAKQVLAVYRSVDGCPTPVVVRDEVGANGRR